MHRALLARLRAQPSVTLALRAKDQVNILIAYSPGMESPCWVAKTAASPEGVRCLQREFEALTYLAPWSEVLGIPKALDLESSAEEAVLVLSAVRGLPYQRFLASDACEATVENLLGPALGWLDRFQQLVPAPVDSGLPALLARARTASPNNAELASALSEIRNFLDRQTSFPDVAVVPVHGDFSPLNMLTDDSRIYVVDWEGFGSGPALQDLFMLFAGIELVGERRLYSIPDVCAHAFFSNSALCRYLARQIQHRGFSREQARCCFYYFFSLLLLRDQFATAVQWQRFLKLLRDADYPAPGTVLVAGGLAA